MSWPREVPRTVKIRGGLFRAVAKLLILMCRANALCRFADDLPTTGATPSLRAARRSDIKVMRELEHGALVDLPNVMGVTPFTADDTRYGCDRYPWDENDAAPGA